MYKEWLASDDVKWAAKRIADLQLEGEKVNREYKSSYRTHVFSVFGGLEWLHAVIALGQLPKDFVEIVRENCMQRKALAPAQGNNPQPRQLKRDKREDQRVVGLQHKKSEAKDLREKAKLLDKRIKKENERYERKESTLSTSKWQALLDERAAAWDKAEAVSRSTGFKFMDRDGKWVNDEQKDLIGLSLCEWCGKHGLVYT